MRRLCFSSIFLICAFTATLAAGQSARGVIIGVVKDQAGAVLQVARIEMQPQLRPISTNGQGEFTYDGFAPYTTNIAVNPGQTNPDRFRLHRPMRQGLTTNINVRSNLC